MSSEYTVYMHKTPSEKVYIGITKQKPVKRWLHGEGYQKQSYFYNAIQKYGWDNIDHIVLCSGLTREQAEEKEKELIELYKSNDREHGYNIENGGRVNKMSDETRKKLKIANLGKHPSQETREKFRAIQTERWKNPEYRRHQSEKRLGKTAWNKGRTTPEETREKQRQRKIGRYTGKDHWNSKPVINHDTGEIYESIGMASKTLGKKNGSKIVSVCKGQRRTAYGFRWAYYEEVI